MLRKLLIGIFVMGFVASAALAQQDEGGETEPQERSTRGWGVHAGYLLADVLSKESFGDDRQFQAELEDDVLIGGSFWADMTDAWRFEIRLNFVPATVSNVAPLGWYNPDNPTSPEDGPARELSGELFYLDVGFIRYFDLSESWRLGVPFGLGWAALYTDEVLSDSIPDRAPSLQQEDGSGMTYYLGAQLVYEMNDSWEIFLDGRFKRFHRLVSVLERTAKTNEFTVGFMKRF